MNTPINTREREREIKRKRKREIKRERERERERDRQESNTLTFPAVPFSIVTVFAMKKKIRNNDNCWQHSQYKLAR